MIFLFIKDESLVASANKLVEITNDCQVITEIPVEEVYLQLDKSGLAIITTEFGTTYVKDLYTKLLGRLKKTSSELLIQSIKSSSKLNILDVTAGLGRDAILIANAGHKVVMVERNPALAIILNYIIQYKIVPKTENLTVVHMDSLDYLQQDRKDLPDIVYLDPMFQDNSKAKPKKDMQIIDMLLAICLTSSLGEKNIANNEVLFNLAYSKALLKVIVKRDNKQNPLVAKPLPTYSKIGKTVRYDVYIT